MPELKTSVKIAAPETLAPNSTFQFILTYINRNDSFKHHLKTVSLAPTWNLAESTTYEADTSIQAGEERRSGIEPINVPPAVGGKQGVLISFEARGLPDEADTQHSTYEIESPFRLPVTGTPRYYAVLCAAKLDASTSGVEKLLENWGYNTSIVKKEQNLVDRFKHEHDSPVCVCSVLHPENNDSCRLVSSTASVAASHDTPSIVFTPHDASLPNLPDECFVVVSDLTDPVELEREAGPVLLGFRQDYQTANSSLLSRIRGHSENVAIGAVKSLATSVAFEITGATDAVTEAITDSDESTSTRTGGSQTSRPTDIEWPMFRGNVANTGYNPHQRGPTTGATKKWSTEFDDMMRSSPAVANGTVYIGSRDHHVYAFAEK